MHPVLFQIFGFDVRAYGLFSALGLLAAIGTLIWLWRGRPRAADEAMDLGMWLTVGGIVGARLAYVIANWDYFSAHPADIIRVDQGGLIFYGGFLMGIFTLFLFAKRKKQPFLYLTDSVAAPVAILHAFGRIGCFLNGCCYGRPVGDGGMACGVVYPPASEPGRLFPDVPLYPVQLMETACLLLLWLGLAWWYPRRKRDGQLMALYLMIYPVCRFILEYFRGDLRQRPMPLSLDTAQLISIGLFLAGLCLFIFLPRKKFIPLSPPPES